MVVCILSATPPAATTELTSLSAAADKIRPRRRARGVLAGVLVMGIGAVVLAVLDPFPGDGSHSVGVSDNRYPTSTQLVLRESISQQTQVSGTLGYAGNLTIRLPAGNAPAMVTVAQQTVTTDQIALAGAQSMLQSDSAALAQARSTLAADREQERVDCTGTNAAQMPSPGGTAATSGAAGGCTGDAQSVLSAQQPITADAAKVSTDQTQVRSAEDVLVTAQAMQVGAAAQATVYGHNSTFTHVAYAGEIVRRGQPLCSVSGEPVLLLYGPTVATRAYTAGMSPGPDVAELNLNLDALGYAHGLTGDAFTSATAVAIGRLQAAHAEPRTDALLLGAVIFEQGPVRVRSVSPTVAVGSEVTAGPLLSATSVRRQVSLQLDAGLEGQVKPGDPVTITLPDNQTTPGRISYVSPVASNGQSGPMIQVDAVPTDPAATGDLDQAPVNVSITTASVSNVLVVPVDALLAFPHRGYVVEEMGAAGAHRLVAVTTGLFDDADGLVQVSGSGLAVGQRVVVPGQ